MEGFAGKRSLPRLTTPCFVDFLLSLQFTRGQNAEKLFVQEHATQAMVAPKPKIDRALLFIHGKFHSVEYKEKYLQM